MADVLDWQLRVNTFDAAALVNWVGFSVGVALFALLAVMVLRHRGGRSALASRYLLLLTAGLGLVWNLGELFLFIVRDFGPGISLPLVTAAAYSALGFLPSVVVHSVQKERTGRPFITYAAYLLSAVAAGFHFYSAFAGGEVPSEAGAITLTIGAPGLALALVALYFRERIEQKAVWAAALLVFALSSLHFAGEREGTSWIVELVAHQSSLPLALVILYQNYRFAFADLFLKRALSVMLLAAVAFGLYVWVAAPLLRYHETHDRNDLFAISTILLMWIGTALAYPSLHRAAGWVVDKVILRRPNYVRLQEDIAGAISGADSVEEVMDRACGRLGEALTANLADWSVAEDLRAPLPLSSVDFTAERAEITVPTTDQPFYRIVLGDLRGGRRLMSDETAMLATVAVFLGRRIDALRAVHERCEQEVREQVFSKLAAEAQLTALRAQVNPHFLFNALTTIGYLIQTAPEKAFTTLLQLTKLLRGVLTKTSEFCTLGDEIRLIESYLEIEKARFEERLTVEIRVPDELASVPVPALLLQPLVENAIKHGISESRHAGTVTIAVETAGEPDRRDLLLTVTDTGSGRPLKQRPSTSGIGLENIEGRLRAHYGRRAALSLVKLADGRTAALVKLPLDEAGNTRTATVGIGVDL